MGKKNTTSLSLENNTKISGELVLQQVQIQKSLCQKDSDNSLNLIEQSKFDNQNETVLSENKQNITLETDYFNEKTKKKIQRLNSREEIPPIKQNFSMKQISISKEDSIKNKINKNSKKNPKIISDQYFLMENHYEDKLIEKNGDSYIESFDVNSFDYFSQGQSLKILKEKRHIRENTILSTFQSGLIDY